MTGVVVLVKGPLRPNKDIARKVAATVHDMMDRERQKEPLRQQGFYYLQEVSYNGDLETTLTRRFGEENYQVVGSREQRDLYIRGI